MSKKKRRRKGDGSRIEAPNNNSTLPFGINPSQLMNMLGGNFDMSQIGNMLSNMKMDGLDLNSFNLGQGNNKNSQSQMGTTNNMGNMMNNMNGGLGGLDFGLFQNMMNNLGINTGMGVGNNQSSNFNNNQNTDLNNKKSKKKYSDDLNITNENKDYIDDENIEMLEAMKKIVEVDKIEFIERIISAYNDGKI